MQTNHRDELSATLRSVLGSDSVYYQPPESLKMKYPAIVYSRDNIARVSANDEAYHLHYYYSVTVIDKDPDSQIVERMARLSHCSFDRHYAVDNLNHDVFTIYY